MEHRQGFKCEDTALDDAPLRRYSCEAAAVEAGGRCLTGYEPVSPPFHGGVPGSSGWLGRKDSNCMMASAYGVRTRVTAGTRRFAEPRIFSPLLCTFDAMRRASRDATRPCQPNGVWLGCTARRGERWRLERTSAALSCAAPATSNRDSSCRRAALRQLQHGISRAATRN
jgi:hypothetical protein